MKSDSGKVSIANIIALIGLSGIGVISFFGLYMHSSDGKPGGAIIGTMALVIGLAFLLFMAIKAKGAEENVDKWRYVEYTCIVLYVVIAIVFSSSFLRFFHIVGISSEMQEQARNEVKAIKDLYVSYDQQRQHFLQYAIEQIKNYEASPQISVKDDLSAYVNKYVVGNPDRWGSKSELSAALPDEAIKTVENLEKRIEKWSYIELSALATELAIEDEAAWQRVSSQIEMLREEHHLFPVIDGGAGTPYVLNDYAEFNLGTPVEARFATMLHEADGSSTTGWIILIFLHLLILLNYLVASGHDFVGIRKNRKITWGAEL